jgi:hypothetical protein
MVPPYSACTASSTYNNDAIGTGYARGAFDSPESWFPKVQVAGEWWQVDLGQPLKFVKGLKTQGRAGGTYWVTALTVNTSTTGLTWIAVDNGATFAANDNGHSAATILFVSPVVTRFVRVIVQARQGTYFGLRVAVLVQESGCPEGQYLSGCGVTTNGTCTGT